MGARSGLRRCYTLLTALRARDSTSAAAPAPLESAKPTFVIVQTVLHARKILAEDVTDIVERNHDVREMRRHTNLRFDDVLAQRPKIVALRLELISDLS